MPEPRYMARCTACRCKLCGLHVLHEIDAVGRLTPATMCPCCRQRCEHWETFLRCQPLNEDEARRLYPVREG